MRCYFVRDGHIAGVEVLPPGISVEDAMTSDGRLAKSQSAKLMASIVAERLIARLERDGFVILRRPGLGGHSALGRGFEPRSG
jgi:hypothetical protein